MTTASALVSVMLSWIHGTARPYGTWVSTGTRVRSLAATSARYCSASAMASDCSCTHVAPSNVAGGGANAARTRTSFPPAAAATTVAYGSARSASSEPSRGTRSVRNMAQLLFSAPRPQWARRVDVRDTNARVDDDGTILGHNDRVAVQLSDLGVVFGKRADA